MKQKAVKTVSIFLIVSILSGCYALHNGTMSNSASLNSPNFTYVKMDAKGSSTATYFLIFGGLMRKTLVNDAKQQLLKENPLKENQALANITVNFKTSFILGLIIINNCTVTADIVQFK